MSELTSESCLAVLSSGDEFFAGKDARAEMAGLLQLAEKQQRDLMDGFALAYGTMSVDMITAVTLGIPAALGRRAFDALSSAVAILHHAEHVVAGPLEPRAAVIVCQQAVHAAASVLYRPLKDYESIVTTVDHGAWFPPRATTGPAN